MYRDYDNKGISSDTPEKKQHTEQDTPTTKQETDARNLLKIIDMTTKVNMPAIHITKSKKELENITGTQTDTPEELAGIVTKLLSDAGIDKKQEENPLETTVDINTGEGKKSDSDKKKKTK